MEPESAEGASARTAARHDDGVLDRGEARHRLGVARMRGPHEGQLVQGVEVGAIDREGGGLLQQRAVAVHLHEPSAAVGRLLGLDHLGQAHEVGLVGLKLLPGGQDQAVRQISLGCGLAAQEQGRATDTREVTIASPQSGDDLADGRLAHAIHEHIGLGVGHDGGLELVFPVVVVSHAAHRSLHAAQHHGNTGKGTSGHLRIDHGRMVRATSGNASGAVHVVLPAMPGGRVVGEHGVEVARGDPHEQTGRSHALDRLDVLPVGLGDDADAQAHVFQHTADHGRTEGRVINVRITCDDEHIQFRPPLGGHFRAGHRQEAVVGNLGTACLAGSHSHVGRMKTQRRLAGNHKKTNLVRFASLAPTKPLVSRTGLFGLGHRGLRRNVPLRRGPTLTGRIRGGRRSPDRPGRR